MELKGPPGAPKIIPKKESDFGNRFGVTLGAIFDTFYGHVGPIVEPFCGMFC